MKKIIAKAAGVSLCAALVFGASAVNGSDASAKTTVKAQSMKVTPTKKTLYLRWTDKKKTAAIKVKFKPKGAKDKVIYKSSNVKVVKVTAKGKVTAVKAGNATVTVTSATNKKLKQKIKFTVKNYNLAFSSKKKEIVLKGTSDTTSQKLTLYGVDGKIDYSSSNEDVMTVDESGKVTAKRLGQSVITATSSKGKTAKCTVTVVRDNLSIHDPSVYKDPVSGKYYTFGSHVLAATSNNLISWNDTAKSGSNYSIMSTLFSKEYTEEFAKAYAFTMPNGANQNAWAPDIIYNKAMKKYCMYMSIVNGSTKCAIAMASSDKPDGPYKYQGLIVCSGIEKDGSDIDKTNVAEALGITKEQAKKSKYATLGADSPDCIDATVFYDHNDNLWLVYGSFTTTGGIRLLKLNPDTGLRGANYEDSGDGSDTSLSTNDPYYGRKIANSNGEGPYIQMIANEKSSTGYYYYLYTSVGNLQNYGGYNMRVVRAENPEGPYYDTKGNEASKDYQKYALGLRVMDNYKFSFMDAADVSQGGNSATDDGNGKTFIQYHVRTSNSDNYTFRTHQTFVNEDGWIVTAPFEYNGETIADSYSTDEVAGDYEFIYHRDTFAKTTNDNMDFVKSVRLTLNSDGTVSGAYTGTWTLNGHNITVTINGKEYKGVALYQYERTAKREKVMVFTAVGNDNRAIWGSKMHKTPEQAVAYDAGDITVPDTVSDNFSLSKTGMFGSDIAWTSDNAAITIDGNTAKVTRGKNDTTVTLTAAVTKGTDAKKEVTFTVKVKKMALEVPSLVQEDSISLPAEFDGEKVTWTSSDAGVIAVDGTVIRPAVGYKKVMLKAAYGSTTKEFSVIVTSPDYENIVYSQDYSEMTSDKAIETVWTSVDKQNCLYVEADATHDSFIKFAAGNTGSSQGAKSDFNLAEDVKKNYTVEFDVALDAGLRESTEFAVTRSDMAYNKDDSNAGIANGYLFKIASDDTDKWVVNDLADRAFELPLSGWVHVKVIVNEDDTKAAVIVSDDTKVYFSDEVTTKGSGALKGLYLRWGCTQALVSVDDVKVTSAK